MSKLILIFMLFSLVTFANQGKQFLRINKRSTPQKALHDNLLKNINNPKNIKFILKKAVKGLSGVKYFHYSYKYKNINVDNQTIVVSQKNNKVFLITGNFNIPKIKSLIPKNTAINVFKYFKRTTNKLKFYSDIKKVIVIKDDKTYLAYKALIEYIDKNGYHLGTIYLDSNNYKKILFKSNIYESLNRKIYDMNNVCILQQSDYDQLPGSFLLNENSSLGSDNVANDAYTNTGITYWFYKNMFNRDSFDNNGISLISSVHAQIPYGQTYQECNGENAFFMGQPYDQMVYGDGGSTMYYLSQALDVTAHELTHAVTDRTSNLYYHGESGALNEATSDIFGATTEAWSNSGGTSSGNPQNLIANANTWKIGEDIMRAGGALRYMNNPHLADGPNQYKPDHYSQRYIGEDDEGGVHINSTIISLAYYLLVSGGNHPRSEFQGLFPDVNGLGLEKAIKIFYEAQTTLFTGDSNFNFSDARRLLSQAAENLYGICSNESEQVNRAFDIVGVPGNRRTECNNITSCDGINCSNHGTCSLSNGSAICTCSTGYKPIGLNCVKDTTTDVCNGVNCSQYYPNTYCLEYQGAAACDCNDGYSWNNDQTACIEDVLTNPCDGISCSNHGTCNNNNNIASCSCDEGYHSDNNLHCIKDIITNPCAGINCSNHGTCSNNNNIASCSCDEGYHSDSNLHCIKDIITNPCANFDCSNNPNTHCINYEGNPACECDENFHLNNERTLCINDISDLCNGIICSNHGICKEENNQALCACEEGYSSDNNLHCIQNTIDLCKNVNCSNHGTCAVSENKAKCICEDTYSSNALTCSRNIIKKEKSSQGTSCNYSNSNNNQSLILLVFIIILLLTKKKLGNN